MSQQVGPAPPSRPQGTARALHRKPSLRWRIRRWILRRLDAWPHARPEPKTEWGRLRRAERKRIVEENRRLADLVVHCRVHSGYRNCGHDQMTSEQRELYDAIWERACGELEEVP